MIIEQSREQMHDAVALHTRASIRWIRLSQANVWGVPHVPREIGTVAFDINFKSAAFHREGEHLSFDTDFSFVLTSESNEKQPLLTVDCRFEAQYVLADGFDPSERQIEAFQAANAVFNCWPFFREYVQNTVVRMNFPPPPVPLLRIRRKPEEPMPGPELGDPAIASNQLTGSRKKVRVTQRRHSP